MMAKQAFGPIVKLAARAGNTKQVASDIRRAQGDQGAQGEMSEETSPAPMFRDMRKTSNFRIEGEGNPKAPAPAPAKAPLQRGTGGRKL